MYMPDWIYEKLPFLYVVIALFGIFSPESYGRTSGIILIVASITIIKMRLNYRKKMSSL